VSATQGDSGDEEGEAGPDHQVPHGGVGPSQFCGWQKLAGDVRYLKFRKPYTVEPAVFVAAGGVLRC
jgi:hypothetical protein